MPKKTVTVNFENETEAKQFLEFLQKNGKEGKLRCSSCGHVYPFNCMDAECEDATLE